MSEDEFLSTGQVAELLGTSRQHVVDLCKRGALPHVSTGTHRRIRRSDLAPLLRKGPTREEERALWLHRAVAAKLLLDPEQVMTKARANLARFREKHTRGVAAKYLAEWDRIVASGVDAVADALTTRSPYTAELHQNSPFSGVLADEERQRVLQSFRRHWQMEH